MRFTFKFLVCGVVTATILIGCGKAKAQKHQEPKATKLSVADFKKIISQNEVQLVDVRTKAEFTEGHILGASNLVYDSTFTSIIWHLDKSQPVAVYCQLGGRSSRSVAILKEAGFFEIYELDGGLSRWMAEGNPVKMD